MLKSIEISDNGVVFAIPANIKGVVLVGGSNASTIKLSDGAAGTDTVRISATAAAAITTPLMFTDLVKFGTAVYATITGTGAKAYVYYN